MGTDEQGFHHCFTAYGSICIHGFQTSDHYQKH